MIGRCDIKLEQFHLNGQIFWMPVRGESYSYAIKVDNKPVITKEPTVIECIYVVGGTMEFNKRPGPDTFNLKYKPGTPVSDRLRQMSYEFGRPKISPRPTKVEVQKMLNEQVATAEAQKAELIVVPPSQQTYWLPWVAGGLGAAVLVSLVALQVQRRMR